MKDTCRMETKPSNSLIMCLKKKTRILSVQDGILHSKRANKVMSILDLPSGFIRLVIIEWQLSLTFTVDRILSQA